MGAATGALAAVCVALVAMVAYLGVQEHSLSQDLALLRSEIQHSGLAHIAQLQRRELAFVGTNSSSSPSPTSASVAPAAQTPAAVSPVPAVAALAPGPVSSATTTAATSGYPTVLLQQSPISPQGGQPHSCAHTSI